MNRRKFIQLTGSAGIATAPIANSLASTYVPNIGSASPDVVVVGAGTFGVWTAWHLNQMGANVTLLDAYGPGNSRASSGGETRLIQMDSDNQVYVKSAKLAYDWWKKMEVDSGETLVLPTGRLTMSQDEKLRAYAENRKENLLSHGISNTEVLSPDEIKYRWPQINSEDLVVAMYNDGGPSGSTLMARKGCETVADQFVKNGGTLRIAKGSPILEKGKVTGVRIEGDQTLKAAHYVFACGPWLTKIFPDLLLPRLKVERRDVLFVGTPSGDNRFSYPNLPEWSVYGSGFYGFPDIDSRGLKVAPYPDYNTFDPDTDERLVNYYQVKRTHDFVKHRFPALGDQPIIESRVCQVTNSIDSNFIVDQLPANDNTWIVGAGSGHGFKHGPSIGEYAAKRIIGKSVDPELKEVFKIKEGVF